MDTVNRDCSTEQHRHQSAAERQLDAPLRQLDLVAEASSLRRSSAFGAHKRAAKTLAKHADLRLVLIAFERGGRLEEHDAPGRVCIQVLDGHVAIRVGDQTLELRAGGLLELDGGLRHEVESLAESALLLTIADGKART